MTTTVVPDMLDHLVALFRNAATIGGATPPVTVMDGPFPSSGPIPLALWVGVEDIVAIEQNDPTQAGDSQKQRDDMAMGVRETLTVPCVAAAWIGNVQAGFSGLRASVATVVKAVETVVLADTAAPYENPGVTNAQWWQRATPDGLQVYVPFHIIYEAL